DIFCLLARFSAGILGGRIYLSQLSKFWGPPQNSCLTCSSRSVRVYLRGLDALAQRIVERFEVGAVQHERRNDCLPARVFLDLGIGVAHNTHDDLCGSRSR